MEIRYDSCPGETIPPRNLIHVIIEVMKERFYELWHYFTNCLVYENHLGKLLKMWVSDSFPSSM
jgi:hypothetical protein